MKEAVKAPPEDDGTMMRMVKVADQRLLLNKNERIESPLGPVAGDGETRFQRYRK